MDCFLWSKWIKVKRILGRTENKIVKQMLKVNEMMVKK
jgi:hypothetical protein